MYKFKHTTFTLRQVKEGDDRYNSVKKLRYYHLRVIHFTVSNKTIVYTFAPCACKADKIFNM